MHSVASVCICVYPRLCFTIVGVGGQQVNNSLWVASATQLAEAHSVSVDGMNSVLLSVFLLKVNFYLESFSRVTDFFHSLQLTLSGPSWTFF